MNIILTAINVKYIHSNLAVYSLRENVKNRPDFVRDYTVSKEMKRQYPKQMHLEKFRYDVMGDCVEKIADDLEDIETVQKIVEQLK